MAKNEQKNKSPHDPLINTGLRLFGESGYGATSTRQIAQAADANSDAGMLSFLSWSDRLSISELAEKWSAGD